MLSLRTLVIAASVFLFAVSTSAAPDTKKSLGLGFPRRQRAEEYQARVVAFSASRSRKRQSPAGIYHRSSLDPEAQLQSILTNLTNTISPIAYVPVPPLSIFHSETLIYARSAGIANIVKDTGSSNSNTTTSNLAKSYSSLEDALNVAFEGVTKLAGQIKGDVDLINLAQTIVNVIADLETALTSVEAGLSIDPALAPLIAALAGILNGPLVSLLTLLEGLLAGLLPVVQGLLVSLGLAPLLLSLQGTVDGLLATLGL